MPVVWAAIAGSAAVLLGVTTDSALPAAGLALAVCAMQRRGATFSPSGHKGIQPQ